MRRLRHPALVAVVLAAFTLAVCGCGYLLYPDRRGATPSHEIDGMVVIMDCLWLLAGIVPGVVALVVDFGTGAAFYSEGHVAVLPGEEVLVRVRGDAPANCEVVLRCVDRQGRDLAPAVRADAVMGRPLSELRLALPQDLQASNAAVVLTVDGREQERWAVATNVN